MVIRKVGTNYSLYTRKKDPKTGHRRRLGVFRSRKAALKREGQIEFFKRRG
ncbi:MAG: hypothetical protein ACRDGN_02245 [bacterium]